ncbi:NADH-quinone oxidoreductase subunit J [Roseivirga sp. E12]|uniref:NADH-quinone oxidoreductase subunit J family protein n=1 Tax=Roseivirga sp. E12 TaxID=2819237 RepID=UPI001ABCC2B4|nr:NADH-quinone oxidoreductase subunit J [Roseivirga sp. E12]MBO3699114.1 NADH-quinone oxidoreductase subunit J [Roseivirga sp. E12]
MELNDIIFYVFGAITALSALYIMLTKNILYAAFALILTFIGVAGIYVFLGAEFIAVTQVLVYVGGILILLVFGIMLTNRLSGKKVVSPAYNKLMGLIVAAGLFAILFKGILQANFSAMNWIDKGASADSSIPKFGLTLMTDYVLVFEIIGVLLLLALIGAIRIAGNVRKEDKSAV